MLLSCITLHAVGPINSTCDVKTTIVLSLAEDQNAMSQNAKSRHSRCAFLQECFEAGILSTITEMLDSQTLETVICHFDDICRSISMTVVKRTLTELFGARWRAYYGAYVSHVEKLNNDDKRHVSVPREPSNAQSSEMFVLEYHPWGLGYQPCFPREPSMINGYVVMTAARALTCMARNCDNYDYSFIPGEPSKCDVDRVSFVENGRLVWIKYGQVSQTLSDGHFAADILNSEANFTSNASTQSYARLDGQILLREDPSALEAIRRDRFQEPYPKKTTDSENELWDIGADTPRCLWSSLWTAGFSKTLSRVRGHIFPLRMFDPDFSRGFLLPSMKRIHVSFSACANIDVEYGEYSCFRDRALRGSLRFVECALTHAVIDLLHLVYMNFRGVSWLGRARLSNGSKYLGAVTQGRVLAVWRVAVPKPSLVWRDGVQLLCDSCDWFIDEDWVITACARDGIRAYNLTLSYRRPINLTPFVAPLDEDDEEIFMKVCGTNNDVIVCNSLCTKSLWFVKLVEYKKGSHRAVPLYLSPDWPTSVRLEARSLGLGACSYIHSIGKRYFLTTTGDLFDLSLAHVSQDITDDGITIERMVTKGLKVVALWESPDNDQALTACYDSHKAEPILTLWSLTSHGEQRQLAANDKEVIRFQDVGLLKFSPDGRMLFVWSRDETLGGWIILIRSRSGILGAEFSIRNLDALPFQDAERTSQELPALAYPVFVTKHTVAMVHCVEWREDEDLGGVACCDSMGFRVVLVRVDEATSELEYSYIGFPAHDRMDSVDWHAKRVYFPRLVDVIRDRTWGFDSIAGINFAGRSAALSPGHRFLLFPARRDFEHPVVPQIEMCDLTSKNREKAKDFRRSMASFLYCLKLRRDFKRVPMYRIG